MRLIPVAGLTPSRWPNGAGRKADIAAGGGWMLGYAWLDADAPFSDLAGFDRTITLVEGPGFTLDIAGRAPLVVDRPFAPAAFDGGAPTHCRIHGPCRVLNVMTARDRWQHTIAIGPAVAPGHAAYVVVLRGRASVAGTALGPQDTVAIDAEAVVPRDAGTLFATVAIAATVAIGPA